MQYWQRMGGPNGITFLAWALLSPISILFTGVVVPEGYRAGASVFAGFAVGLIAHLVTGAVLLLGKVTVLRDVSESPRPVETLLIFAAAGLTRGFSVALLLELFGIVEVADYPQRMASGAALILVWFAISAVMVDGIRAYRASFDALSKQLESQDYSRFRGARQLEKTHADLIDQIRVTLANALRTGSTPSDIHNAVDELVRPLAHRLAETSKPFILESQPPRRRLALLPVARTALTQTPFNPGWTFLMAVVGTLYSRIWQFGPIGIVDSAATGLIIWACFSVAKKLRITGAWVLSVWFLTGLIASTATALLTNGFSGAGFPTVLYLSVNVFFPAAIVSAIGAFDREATINLERLRDQLELSQWQTASLEQRDWVEQQRLARFVHSELQGRLRAFALRMDMTGRMPSDEDILQLRVECEDSLVNQGRQQEFEDFMASAIELWDQVMTVSVEPGIDALFALRNDPYASSAAIEICREALNNSAKHGRATQATIKLSIEQSDHRQRLTIEIVDNGRAPGALGTGLGSKTLNELSLNWNVVVSEQGAVLRAEIPIKFASEPVQTPH